MELSGTAEIAATRAATWDLLMDVDRLARCGPDVDSIERQDATHARIRATVGAGFMKAGVTIDLELTDIEAPDRIAVHGRGDARVHRAEVVTGLALRRGIGMGLLPERWVDQDVARAEDGDGAPLVGILGLRAGGRSRCDGATGRGAGRLGRGRRRRCVLWVRGRGRARAEHCARRDAEDQPAAPRHRRTVPRRCRGLRV